MSGEEAYQRRLALAAARSKSPAAPAFVSSAPSAVSPQPSERRGTSELGSTSDAGRIPSLGPSADPPAVATPPLAQLGDDVYARRAALSANQPGPSFAPAAAAVAGPAPPSPPSLAYNPFAPPSSGPPPPPPPSTLEEQIKARRDAAAAIAAKLGMMKAAGGAETPPAGASAPTDEDPNGLDGKR